MPAAKAPALPPPAPGTPRRSSGEQAARYIRRLIFDGVLRPGQRVPQDLVAQTLGVSRIPVREALIALEREGWITIQLHRGAFINTISVDSVRDHYALYGLIYGFAVRRALERGSLDFPERLGKVADALVAAESEDAVSQRSIEFHNLVLAEAGNRRIGSSIRALSALVPGSFFVEVPDAVPAQKRGISAIARAVKARDADRAAAGYERVMRQVGEQVVDLFEARGLFGAS
ncbi:MAG: GntR family transcriptional regulator [Acidimicrobiaceae bacterium]|nr:GntR family transcriptional regulator [Acidimicrobiaceae bacterium]